MRVLFAYADYAEGLNTSMWRCFIPAEALRRAGHQAETITVQELILGQHHYRPEDFDVLVIERELFNCMKIIPKWREHVPVIATFDDAYHLIPESVPSFPTWRKGDAVKRFRMSLREVDAYMTPSELLTDDFRHINPNAYTVKNYPDLAWDCWKAERKPHEGIRIGWGGSVSHHDSWLYSGAALGMRKILDEFPDVTLTIISGDIRLIAPFAGLDHRKFIYKKQVPFEEWPAQLASWDIGLAPLHGEYDRRRSWIKVLEYFLMGVYVVASDMEPYYNRPAYLKGASVPLSSLMWMVDGRKPIEWYEVTKRALETVGKDVWQFSIRENKKWAMRQGIDDKIGEYVSVFEKVIDERKARLVS